MAASVAIFATVIFVVFPSDPFVGDAVVNVFTHLVGYALGALVPYATVEAIELGSRARERRTEAAA